MQKNNYVIVSNDKIVIDNKISKILAEINIKDIEIIKYDMSEVLISTVIEELDTYNFLSPCKLVVCYNCTFLEGEANKEIKLLKNYLLNFGDNYLVMVSSKVSDKKEIKELLANNVEVIDSGISSEVLVKNNLEKFKMENKTVKYFVSYCLSNNEKILNELEKIKHYKNDDPNNIITVEDIDRIAIREYDEDIFDLVNAIVRRNKKLSFDIYSRIIKKEKDTINIIASVASQIRILYSVKVLSNMKMGVEAMAKIIDVKPRAVSIALDNCYNFSEKKLLNLLNELADIDYKSKSSSSTSGVLLFRTFLLNI